MADSSLVLIEPDPFIGVGETVSSYIPQYGNSGEADAKKAEQYANEMGFNLSDITNVSRPLNGIAVKPNTHAWVQVLKEDGKPILLFNALGKNLGSSEEGSLDFMSQSGTYGDKAVSAQALGGSTHILDAAASTASAETGGLISGSALNLNSQADALEPVDYGADGGPNSAAWTDWILQSVREQRVEKTQVVETFGDTYFYAFGERPRALQFQGLLMNSLDYNWRAIFWENWDRFFRATKLIEAGARMYIGWEDVIVEGYPINAAASETADSPNAMTFQFTFYITNYINTSAQSGFVSQQAARIARVRGGYIGGDKTGKMSELRPNHGLEWAGPYGATQAGGIVEAALLKKWGAASGTGAVSGLAGAAARYAGSSVAEAADVAAKTGMAFATSQGVGAAFFTNWYRQFAFNTMKFWVDIYKGKAEKEMGVQPGEINAWFGFAANIVNRLNKGSVAQEELFRGGSTTNLSNPNWLGKRAGTEVNMLDALKSGSIDEIIGAMAYSLPALPGYQDGTFYETAYSSGRPAAATMVQMIPFEDLDPASTIIAGREPGIEGEGGGGPIGGGGTVTPADLIWS